MVALHDADSVTELLTSLSLEDDTSTVALTVADSDAINELLPRLVPEAKADADCRGEVLIEDETLDDVLTATLVVQLVFRHLQPQ